MFNKYFILFLLGICSCSPSLDIEKETNNKNSCFLIAKDKGYLVEIDGQIKLKGGNLDQDAFEIDNWSLKPCNLKYGLGRETIQALNRPDYVDAKSILNKYKDIERVIVVKDLNDGFRAYPISLLTYHEVINETINNEPIMIAYCVLANLGAVYTRKYCDQIFTFAVSGYTYFEPEVWDGLDGFILWDRETESLWWPLIDQSVVGKMNEVNFKIYDTNLWYETTWKKVKQMKNVLVLKSGQKTNNETKWKTYPEVNCK